MSKGDTIPMDFDELQAARHREYLIVSGAIVADQLDELVEELGRKTEVMVPNLQTTAVDENATMAMQIRAIVDDLPQPVRHMDEIDIAVERDGISLDIAIAAVMDDTIEARARSFGG